MRKLENVLCLAAIGLGLASCSTKNIETTTKKESKPETKIEETTPKSSTYKELVDNTEIKMPEFHSSYTATMEENLPKIEISANCSLDFVTKPMTIKSQPQYCEPWYEESTLKITDGSNQVVMEDESCKVKVRGNWTTNYDKKPLKIKFPEKKNILGLNDGDKDKEWVLLAGYKDWSLLRDASSLYLSHLLSRNYSSDFRLVEVYINSQYWGVYLLAEQQKVSGKRIDITKADSEHPSNDIGYFLEFDGYYTDEENSFTIDYKNGMKDYNDAYLSKNGFMPGYTIKSDITQDSQKEYIKTYMNSLWTLLYEASYNNVYYTLANDGTLTKTTTQKNSYEAVNEYVDIESLVDAYILQEIVCDPDIYWSSFYMDLDLNPEHKKKLTFEAPWDFDSSLGNKAFCTNGQGIYAGAIGWDVNHSYQCANPWMFIFLHCDWFQALVKQKWQMLAQDGVFDTISTFITTSAASYSSAFTRNNNRWSNIGHNDWVGNELCANSAKCKTQAEAASYLNSWYSTRIQYLNSIWAK